MVVRGLFCLEDDSRKAACQHWFFLLVAAGEGRNQGIPCSFLFVFVDGDFTENGVTGEDRTQKLEMHRSGKDVMIAANLGRQRGSQEALYNQLSLFIRRDMVRALITGKLCECFYIFHGKRPFKRNYISHFQCQNDLSFK